jgi:hypothetical protein
MKTRIKTLTVAQLMPGFARACAMLCIGTITLFTMNPLIAQNGNPPPPPANHGEDTNQPPGGGAPITGGIGILLALGAAYGAKKQYNIRKNKPAE